MSWWEEELAELEELREEEALRDPILRLLCRCRGVEEAEVEALVREGAGYEEIVARTGATTGCGGCRGILRSLVRSSGDAREKEVPCLRSSLTRAPGRAR